ncbi:2,3-butanediol dehydrogenase [Flavobacterium sp. DG1-102-2]|uniref:2,3-butanediol dehydrogenase n=1 Tax=Flavobacterium sp. DG1-102-2 TaxID=3081663 RepID=UPI00294A158C|nr:2,3-butanediol dehydrogenase [Flavobacterium sp. DG1-102-2]MDV6168534.1 2,3-butanediol dehydrogenase [Flavobacterium sp. DG1-102-2]
MSNTMKAARWHAAKDIRVEQAEIPAAGKKQVKIEVQFTGICGSDLHEYTHGPMLIPVDKPYPLNGHQGVTTLGHEFSGIVSEIGEGVTNVKPGDRVVVEPLFKNPDSPFIANGEYNLSEPLGFVGLTSNGGFAKYTVVEDYMVHKIPDTMSFEQGALVEPAAVAVYAVLQSGLSLGDSCVIFGAGPIGLLCVQAAIAAGSPNVIVVDVADKRLEKATEVGATHVINGKSEDIPAQVKKLTNGGADVFLDAAGVQATYDNGLKSLRNGGTAVLVALFGKPVTHDAFDQVVREITVKGIIAYRNIFPQVINLIDSGRMPVEKLVTQKIKLDNIVADGFEALVSNPSQVKILVDING